MKKEANLIFGLMVIFMGLFTLTINGNYKYAFAIAFFLLGIVFIRHYLEDCKCENEMFNTLENSNNAKESVLKEPISNADYKLPSVDILGNKTVVDSANITEVEVKISLALGKIGIKAEVNDINIGPMITRAVLSFEDIKSAGELLKIIEDFTYELTYGDIQLNKMGNNKLELLFASVKKVDNYLINCIDEDSNNPILYIGKEYNGNSHILNLSNHPSLALTGDNNEEILSLMNDMIISLLMKNTPNDLELILIDNGGLNFNEYVDLPHLVSKIGTNNVLNEVINELGIRLEKLGNASCKNINEYNDKSQDKMKSMVIFINDLDYVIYKKDNEYLENLKTIMSFGKMVGIYLVCSVNYTENDSKEKLLNICDTVIAFKASNILDKCTVCYLDKNVKITPAMVSNDNIKAVTKFWKNS